jgi:hypothetical protein
MTRAPALSFIVRVYTGEDGQREIRGEIEHIGTGEKRLFLDKGTLLNLIDGWRDESRPSR